jgi:aspartate-semialdehyde dehydrogenase
LADTSQGPRLAVVGGDSLLAREIRAVLGEETPAPRLQLISAVAENAQTLAADEEEALVMAPLSAETLEGTSVAFLAGSAASSRRAWRVNPEGGPRLIDLTGSLEEQPEARLRAPSAEPAGLAPSRAPVQVIAHPAAIALTTLLARLGAFAAMRGSIAHIFEPASERGERGLRELQKQTVAVLSFHKLPQDVFDTQVAFSMLARYGEEALEPLEEIEQRIERHVASLLAHWPGVPMPSLRLIQAPVFHGHSLSVWVEFEQKPDLAALADHLSAGGFDVRRGEPPANAGIAGQSGLSVGAIASDHNNARACWLWMVADNLRLAAENAVAVAKETA